MFTLRLNHTKGEAKVKQPNVVDVFFLGGERPGVDVDGILNDTCSSHMYIYIYMFMIYLIH